MKTLNGLDEIIRDIRGRPRMTERGPFTCCEGLLLILDQARGTKREEMVITDVGSKLVTAADQLTPTLEVEDNQYELLQKHFEAFEGFPAITKRQMRVMFEENGQAE